MPKNKNRNTCAQKIALTHLKNKITFKILTYKSNTYDNLTVLKQMADFK